MRTPTMIAIGGAAALAVAWLLLTRPPPPPTRQPVVVAAPAPSVPAPVEPPSTTPAPVASPTPPAPEPPPAPAAEPKPDAAAQDEPPASDDATADTQAEDEAPADEESGPEPIDANHAADLMADWIASQEAAGADDPEKMDHALKTFDDEGAGDPEWSESAEKKVEAVLDEWLAGLPEEIRQHVELLSVECRITLCQILAADNDAATVGEQRAQDWQQAMALLPQQPWWHELGFVDMTTTMRGDTENGFLLYQTYLMREPPPPAE